MDGIFLMSWLLLCISHTTSWGFYTWMWLVWRLDFQPKKYGEKLQWVSEHKSDANLKFIIKSSNKITSNIKEIYIFYGCLDFHWIEFLKTNAYYSEYLIQVVLNIETDKYYRNCDFLMKAIILNEYWLIYKEQNHYHFTPNWQNLFTSFQVKA